MSFCVFSGTGTPRVTSFSCPKGWQCFKLLPGSQEHWADSISGVAAELPSDTGASHLTSAMILLQNRGVIRPKCFHSTQKLLQARCCVCNSAACRLSQGPAFTSMGAESLRAPIPCSHIRVISERYCNGWSLKFASPTLEKGLT